MSDVKEAKLELATTCWMAGLTVFMLAIGVYLVNSGYHKAGCVAFAAMGCCIGFFIWALVVAHKEKREQQAWYDQDAADEILRKGTELAKRARRVVWDELFSAKAEELNPYAWCGLFDLADQSQKVLLMKIFTCAPKRLRAMDAILVNLGRTKNPVQAMLAFKEELHSSSFAFDDDIDLITQILNGDFTVEKMTRP